jgi:hypothetical protein
MGEGWDEGGRLTWSVKVSQWDFEIRVATRPGAEGVPRWSSLDSGLGLDLDGIERRSTLPGGDVSRAGGVMGKEGVLFTCQNRRT